ncbi:MAG: hypothetical protein U0T84_08450 [Chitinophagales bacterium]
MPSKQDFLKHLVQQKFPRGNHGKVSFQDLHHSVLLDEARDIYKKLGGQLTEVPIRYGPWDIATRDFIIELDEERHFNRYRLLTLQSKLYDNNPSFSVKDYRSWCADREPECLKSASFGGYWKNNASEKMFLPGEPNGSLKNNGSSRWRQRAYYDFLKDLSAKITDIPVIRISTYECFGGFTVNHILKQKDNVLALKLVEEKIKRYG